MRNGRLLQLQAVHLREPGFPRKQALQSLSAFSRKSQASSSLLLLLVHRGCLQLACLGDLGDGVFSFSCCQLFQGLLSQHTSTASMYPFFLAIMSSSLPCIALSSLLPTAPCCSFPLYPLLPLLLPLLQKAGLRISREG